MKGFLSLVVHSLALIVSASTPELVERQELSPPQLETSCFAQYTVEYGIAPSVIGQPVEVVTSFAANTTMVLAPYDMPITISNAPMTLSTVVTAFSTITNTLVRRYVALTSFYTGQAVTTQTMVDPLNTDAITTFLVLVPSQSGSIAMNPGALPLSVAAPFQYTTVTSAYAGPVAATTTVAVPSLPGQIGTVVVLVPEALAAPSPVPAGAAVVTYTVGYDGNVVTTKSYLPDPTGPNIVTVLVATPTILAIVTVTETLQWTGSVPLTRTIPPVPGGSTATVQIFTPAAQLPGQATVPDAGVVTYTIGYGGNAPTTQSYPPDPAGLNIVTVVVQTPTGLNYITQTTDYIGTGLSTRTIYPPPGSSTATVQIFVPALELASGSTVPGAGIVTLTEGYDGVVPFTRTFVPNVSGANIVTVLVQTPTIMAY
jgi:hypothetical protein